MYEKRLGAKVKYNKVNPTKLVEGNLEYIVGKLNQLQGMENNMGNDHAQDRYDPLGEVVTLNNKFMVTL